MTGQIIGAGGVHVAGDFQVAAGFPTNWDPTTVAMTTTGANIYKVTVKLPNTNTTYQYKYYKNNIAGATETVPNACAVSGNRSSFINHDTTITLVCFSACGACCTLTAAAGQSNNPTCFNGTNGTATVNIIGGTGAITYTWNTNPIQTTPTATNLGAGNYTCTINDGICSQTVTFSLSQPSAINVTTTNSPLNCFGSNNGTGISSSQVEEHRAIPILGHQAEEHQATATGIEPSWGFNTWFS